MTDLNNFYYTDGVNDVMAAYVNQLVAGNLRGELTNVETLSADKTLTNANFPIQSLVPSGADRNVTLLAVAAANHLFVVMNRAATLYSINVKNAGGTVICTLRPGATELFVSDGTNNWYCASGLSRAGGMLTGVLDAVQLDVRKLAGQASDLARFGDGATDYLAISPSGILTLHGAAVVENDLAIGAHSLRNGATPPTWTAYNGALYAPEFINASTTDLHGSFELLHDYKDGSNLTFHIHWSPSTTNAGNCKWGLDYSICNIDGTWAAPTTVTITPAASGVVRKHTLTDLAVIAGAGLTKGATIDFRIYRLGADVADTFTGSAYLHFCGIHYWADKLGS